MFKYKSKLLAAIALGIGLTVGTGAVAQLIYGNTFPFWNVNGPLTVVGNTSLTGGTNTLGGTTAITGTTTIGAGATLTSPALVSPTITGTGAITGATLTGTTQVTTPLLTTSGYLQFPTIRTVTGDATVAATDSWIIANKAGTIALTLPDATAAAQIGRLICVKTSNAQTVTAVGSVVVPLITAAAGTAILAATAGKWACMVSDGTNWVIMAAN